MSTAFTRLVVSRDGEERSDHLLPLSDPLAAQRRRRDGEEGRPRLVRYRLSDQSLA